MMKQLPDKTPPLIPRERLRHQISHIHRSVNIACPPLISGAAFTNEVECHTLRLLLESRGWYRSVSQHRLIVSKDEYWSIDRIPKHPQLIPQTSKVVSSLFHCHGFTAKCTSLHRSFLLTMHGFLYSRSPVIGTQCVFDAD